MAQPGRQPDEDVFGFAPPSIPAGCSEAPATTCGATGYQRSSSRPDDSAEALHDRRRHGPAATMGPAGEPLLVTAALEDSEASRPCPTMDAPTGLAAACLGPSCASTAGPQSPARLHRSASSVDAPTASLSRWCASCDSDLGLPAPDQLPAGEMCAVFELSVNGWQSLVSAVSSMYLQVLVDPRTAHLFAARTYDVLVRHTTTVISHALLGHPLDASCIPTSEAFTLRPQHVDHLAEALEAGLRDAKCSEPTVQMVCGLLLSCKCSLLCVRFEACSSVPMHCQGVQQQLHAAGGGGNDDDDVVVNSLSAPLLTASASVSSSVLNAEDLQLGSFDGVDVFLSLLRSTQHIHHTSP